MSVLFKAKKHYQESLPFVIYRKPNEALVSGFFMKNDELDFTTDFSQSGFVFAPFDDEQQAVLFPLNNAEFYQENLNFSEIEPKNNSFSVNDSDRETYMNIVEKAIDTIKNSELEKVVLSRKETVVLSNFDLITVYTELLQRYKNAFVYLWFHPKVGLWLGATPEILLQLHNSDYTTMSLAGTQKFEEGKNVVWQPKELEEQEIVTQFIKYKLIDISTNLRIDKTETFRAGSLLHLRTKVEGKLNRESSLQKLIKALHPTPAVCGFTRGAAKAFILKNENYNREFYTGFLGEINLGDEDTNHKKSHLFVNLRCMQINSNTTSIYVGGGVTKDSIPESEWQETVNKTVTMKTVLQ